jgi:integrase
MSIYKRPGSKYYWTKFELNGTRFHKSTKATNLHKAVQWEAALRTQMQRVLVGLERDPAKNTTLREFRERFLDEIRSVRSDRRAAHDFYERRYDELLAYDSFEGPLSEIDEQKIDAFRTWKQGLISRFGRKYSTASVNPCLATLKRALRLAYRWRMIERVPQISLLNGEQQKDSLLYSECEQEFLNNSPETLRTYAVLSIDLGLRLKEFRALCTQRIRFSPAPGAPLGYVEVRAFQDPLKSHYSNRDVPLTARARRILEQISKDCYTATLFPIPKSTVQHQMQRTCRKLKLEGLSLHSFRHTFGTRLGEAGASALVVKQLMGHSSITVSQRYVHKLTESVERAMAAMEEANHCNNKVGTIPGHVRGEDVAWAPAKPPHTSSLRVQSEM